MLTERFCLLNAPSVENGTSRQHNIRKRLAQTRGPRRAARRCKSMAMGRYPGQISGIAIEGHRRARKSRFLAKVSPRCPELRVVDEVAPLRGRAVWTRAFTHLRARSQELRAICSACVCTHNCERVSECVYPMSSPRDYTRAFTSPATRAIARSGRDSIVSRTRGSHASRRSCKLNICRPRERAHACRKIAIFIVTSITPRETRPLKSLYPTCVVPLWHRR